MIYKIIEKKLEVIEISGISIQMVELTKVGKFLLIDWVKLEKLYLDLCPWEEPNHHNYCYVCETIMRYNIKSCRSVCPCGIHDGEKCLEIAKVILTRGGKEIIEKKLEVIEIEGISIQVVELTEAGKILLTNWVYTKESRICPWDYTNINLINPYEKNPCEVCETIITPYKKIINNLYGKCPCEIYGEKRCFEIAEIILSRQNWR